MAERAVLAADSGITADQTWIDEIAANIANANTVGYKDSEVQFSDLLSEELVSPSAPTGTTSGGINPVAIGSGVEVGADAVDLSEGSLEQTGVDTDVAISGNGYLVVDQDGSQRYTRDGSLTIDESGDLTTQGGGLVQGWQATSDGTIDTNAPTTAINIPTDETIGAQATSAFTLGGNLPSWSGTGTPPVETTTYDAYDSLGNSIPVTLTFTAVSGEANEWSVDATCPNPSGGTENLFTSGKEPVIAFDPASGQVSSVTVPSGGTGTVTTNTDGSISLAVGAMPTGYSFPSGDTWSIDFPAPDSSDAVTQYAGAATITMTDNGYASGTLEAFSIADNGVITGSFSNGETLNLGQIALANFANPSGLLDAGDGSYSVTANSGQAEIGVAGSGSLGTLLGGQLEQSNVDLDTQLTDLIEAQVAYTANTKPLTAEQQALQSLEQLP